MSSTHIESTRQLKAPPFSGFDVHSVEPLTAGSSFPAGSLVVFVSLALVILAFVPLVPPVDVLEGGGVTARGGIEFSLILIGVLLFSIYAKATDAFVFDLTNPAFVIISLFVFWAVLSSIWSPNPFLTVAKSAELWLVALAAAMCVSIIARSNASPGKL